jgi:hypothetical protein
MADIRKNDPKSKKQIDRFRETARDLETDEDEDAFDEALKRVAKAPPPKD